MRFRFDPAQVVATRLKVTQKTIRRWALGGWIESRRVGPRLVYVKVHDGGELDGQPVGLEEQSTPQPGEPT